jgi:hypothetical protein
MADYTLDGYVVGEYNYKKVVYYYRNPHLQNIYVDFFCVMADPIFQGHGAHAGDSRRD